ncbi:hypothetical protein BSTEL_1512, partial [Bifidobacterium stellenboschense]
ERRRAAAETAAAAARAGAPGAPGADDADRTGSADIVAAGEYAPGASGADDGTGSTKPQRPAYPDMPAPDSSVTITLQELDDRDKAAGADGGADGSAGNDADAGSGGDAGPRMVNGMPMPPTIKPIKPLSRVITSGTFDAPSVEPPHEPSTDTSATVVIPLLEREERALRDARAGLDFDDETFDDKPHADGDYTPSEGDETPKVSVPAAAESTDPGSDGVTGIGDVTNSADAAAYATDAANPIGDPDDTPSVTPIVVAAPSVAVIASTGTVTSDETNDAADNATDDATDDATDVNAPDIPADEAPAPADEADDDTGEAHTIPDDVKDVDGTERTTTDTEADAPSAAPGYPDSTPSA